MIKGSGRLQRPIPHPSTDLTDRTVMVPEQKPRAETVAVVKLVIVPDFPDTFGVHCTDKLSLLGKLLYGRRSTIIVDQIGVQARHQMKTVAVKIVPDKLIHRPQIRLRHHLTQDLHGRKGGSTVFRVETVNATATGRSGVLIMLHWIHLLVRAPVMDTRTL